MDTLSKRHNNNRSASNRCHDTLAMGAYALSTLRRDDLMVNRAAPEIDPLDLVMVRKPVLYSPDVRMFKIGTLNWMLSVLFKIFDSLKIALSLIVDAFLILSKRADLFSLIVLPCSNRVS